MTRMELVHVPGLGRSEGARKSGPRGKRGGRPKADEKFAIEQRRVQVAALYLAKESERSIARRFGVSRSAIRKDIKAIKEQWRARSAVDYDARVAEEEAKLDGIERALLPRAFMGDHDAVGDQLKVAHRRAQMLGLDKPTKIDATVHVDLEAEKERGLRLVETVEAQRAAG